MIRGIIFDLGNTLLYLERDWKLLDVEQNRALMRFLNENGITVGEDFPTLLRAARADGWKLAEETALEHTVAEALEAVLAQLGHTSLNGLVQRAVDRFFGEGEVYWRLYPGALETCQALGARGIRVGLISNADDDGLIQRAAVATGLAAYMDPVLSSAGMRWRKPNPKIFRYVATRWQLDPAEVAMVGDSPKYDIAGAHRAGMRGILVDRHEGHSWQAIPAELADDPMLQADATVENLLDIPHVIQKL